MLRQFLCIVVFLISSIVTFAQVRATTESGNKVLLFDDGTWKYEEKAVTTPEPPAPAVVAVAAIAIDTSREVTTEPNELFNSPSPRLVKYFGDIGGNIRCKMSCSNIRGNVRVHFMWEFPVSDGHRYFGSFNEGSVVSFIMEDGQKIDLVMGEKSDLKIMKKNNYSLISNVSLPLTDEKITALTAQPFNKMEVGWKKNSEEYRVVQSRYLMDTLPTVF